MIQTQTTPLASPTLSPPPSVLDGDLFSHTPQARQPDKTQQRAAQLISAAESSLAVLCQGQALEAKILRSADRTLRAHGIGRMFTRLRNWRG